MDKFDIYPEVQREDRSKGLVHFYIEICRVFILWVLLVILIRIISFEEVEKETKLQGESVVSQCKPMLLDLWGNVKAVE